MEASHAHPSAAAPSSHAGISEWFAACERHERPPEQRQLNRTYWAIVDEDPERAYAGAGPHFMHMFNDYIRREGYPGLVPFDDPAPAREMGLEGGYLLVADAAGAIEAFNEDVAAGTRDINLLAFMPGEDIDAVSARLQYLSDHVIPHVDGIERPGGRLGPTADRAIARSAGKLFDHIKRGGDDEDTE